MLTIDDLEGVKLVHENYLATDAEARNALENAFQQGSQGWGVRLEQGVMLKLARDLKIALSLAATADEAQRKVKGLQLANGRLKKTVAEQDEQIASLQAKVHLCTAYDKLEAENAELKLRIDSLLAAVPGD